MSETRGILAGVAGRYAKALFELAEEAGAVEEIRKDAATLRAALAESDALAAAVEDPSISREAMAGAVAALAEKLDQQDLTRKFLGLMAGKRRLGALARALDGYEALAAEKRGETTAEVVSAAPLSEAQQQKLASDLAQMAGGRTVHMKMEVDPDLIGGLVVRMGSKMIDASIRSKLTRLQQSMKEARR